MEWTIKMAPVKEGGCGLLTLRLVLHVVIGIDEAERGEAIETCRPVLIGRMFLVEVHAAVEVSN